MAKAEKGFKEIEVLIKQRNVVITLDLTYDEAQALRTVVSKVGGCPKISRRKLIDDIAMALERVGIYHSIEKNMDAEGSISFKDRK